VCAFTKDDDIKLFSVIFFCALFSIFSDQGGTIRIFHSKCLLISNWEFYSYILIFYQMCGFMCVYISLNFQDTNLIKQVIKPQKSFTAHLNKLETSFSGNKIINSKVICE